MAVGYIKLFRQIAENPLWQERPFTRGQAWVDLLLLANGKDGTIWVRGISIKINRGQVGWSRLRLGKRWGWSRGKTDRFMRYLEDEQNIVQETIQQNSRLTILITIVNYEKYNPLIQQTGQQTESEQKVNGKRTESEQGSIKKDNKGNKVKKVNNKDIVGSEEIVDYLNTVLNAKYQKTGQKIRALIKARQGEGHTVDDFKKVIDIKYAEWKDDKDMVMYLRPETLFGTKFESYLNQKPPNRQPFSEKTKGNFAMVKRRAAEREEKERLEADNGKILQD